MMEKRLLISLFFLFALSSVFLIGKNIHGLDPTGKNWWSLAFTEPTNAASFEFTVTNYTDDPSFRYTVTRESVVLDSGEFSVQPGTSRNNAPKFPIEPATGRITITVSHDENDETIYREL